MKPISVRFSCFGPYMAEQTVDFTTLGRDGLFLICGETGSGKTTMLDAMCYALYGASSGGTRGDLEAMRCKLAGHDDVTLVEFIFESNNRRYRFYRDLHCGKRSTTLKEENSASVWRNDTWEPLLENPTKTNVNKMAEELIGLTADQFRQVIILPQGRFERLLTSDSTEKEKILVSLFRADRWQRIVDSIKEKVDTQDKELKARERDLVNGLARYDCTNVQGLAQLAEDKAQELVTLSQAQEGAAKAFEAQQKAYGQAQLLSNRFEELTRRVKAHEQMVARVPAQDAEDELLRRAARAERLAPEHKEYLRVCGELSKAEKDVREAATEKRRADQLLGTADNEQRAHENGKPEQEKRRELLIRLQNAGEAYHALEQATQDGKTARVAQTKAETEAKVSAAALQKADTAYLGCTQAQVAALNAFTAANNAYRAGICGTLAATLKEGVSCPVCGSMHHPAPAASGENTVTDAEVKAAQEAWQRADSALKAAEKARQEAQERDNAAQQEQQRANSAMNLATQTYQLAQKQCIEGINDAAALARETERLSREVKTYDEQTESLRKALDGARNNVTTWQTKLHDAEENCAKCKAACDAQTEAWQRLLEDAGFADEAAFKACLMDHDTLARRQTAAQKFRNDLENARREAEAQQVALAGQTAPDMAAENKRLTEAQDAKDEAQRKHTQAEQKLGDMKRDLSTLKRLAAATETERIQVNESLAFVKHLVGSRDTSLQRYVLSVMLSAITEQANLLLRNIHGGRYRLYRSGEGKGLDLEVLDSMSATRRSVSTLSGGEKFLVSLSLAIGLSTVVQAQGASSIRMEALFIDEGFGSLDANSISDAMDVLSTIQRSKGMVGIISHVDRLRETIPARVEVTKGRSGSTLKVVG